MSSARGKVKLRLRFKEEGGGPAGESLWAEPVEAHSGGGTYRLANHAFLAPLVVGDLVEARLDGDSILQVVDVLEPADAVLTVVSFDRDEGDRVCSVADGWRDHGAQWSEGHGGLLCTSWPGMSTTDVLTALTPAAASGLVTLVELLLADERAPAARECLDLALDTRQHFPPVATSYWAPDDPWWAEHGLGDPDVLASVQILAAQDQRLARALEAGRHEEVVRELERTRPIERDG